MADIFLSYSREDHARAEQLAKALTAAGYEVFWDVEIPPGKSWADVLEEKLGVCKAAIVLWSRISTASKWVREEARLAHDRGKLIPVQIDEAPPPFGFGEIQAADLKHWRGDTSDPHWRTFLNAVAAAVARPPASAAPIAPPSRPVNAMAAPSVSSLGSWFAPATRGYILAGVGVLALLGAIALRYMPSAPRDHADGTVATTSTVVGGSSTPTPGAGSSEASDPGTASSGSSTSQSTVVPSTSTSPPAPETGDGTTLLAGVTRQEILSYLGAHGYGAKLATDENSNSIVKTAVDGVTFNVYFYNCQGERCAEIQFSAGWQMPKPPTLAMLNAWNSSKRLARAYTTEKGDGLFVEMDMNLANATSLDQIDEYLQLWKTLLGSFKKQFSL